MSSFNELNKKLKNYNNIKSLVNLSFLQVLGQYKILNESTKNQIKEACVLKQTYDAIKEKYRIESFFYNGFQSKKGKVLPKLIIYIAEKAKYSALSFSKTDNKILNILNKEDLFIPIGDYAIEFAKRKNLDTYQVFEKNSVALTEEIKSLAYQLYTSKAISEFTMIYPSNNLRDDQITILPIRKNILTSNDEKISLNKILLYPDINTFISGLNLIYLNFTINSAIIDASFYSIKQKIIKLKTLLESIDTKIATTQLEILKEKRKTLTEDIIITTQ